MDRGSLQDVLSTLRLAGQELDKALGLTAITIVIPQAERSELSVMRDDLDRIIAALEKTSQQAE